MHSMVEANVMDEDWAVLLTMMPDRWRELAQETEALKGLRKDKGEADFLRTLLLHLACGYSLRETAVRAREANLADLSDVAVLKRLRARIGSMRCAAGFWKNKPPSPNGSLAYPCVLSTPPSSRSRVRRAAPGASTTACVGRN